MHSLQGEMARRYYRRKKRTGAFWSDRYHATSVSGGDHLWLCLKYIDLNMVRAGVVHHPQDWKWCAYREIMDPRERYQVIHMDHQTYFKKKIRRHSSGRWSL